MRVLKPTDLNIIIPPMEKAKLLAEVNLALEIQERLQQQIIHWSKSSNTNLTMVNLVMDELLYLKKGKI